MGKPILNYYKEHNQLDNKNRCALVNLLIQKEGDLSVQAGVSFKMTKERFVQITKDIKKVFKNEPENVYYIPFSQKKKQPQSGKLFQSYACMKRKLNLSTKRKAKIEEVKLEADLDKLSFLKNTKKLSGIFYAFWKDTLNYRLQNLKNSEMSLKEYFKIYPILNESNGYQLFEQDFSEIFPNSSNFEEEFNKIYLNICKVAASIKISLNVLCKDLRLNALLLLPMIINTTTAYCSEKKKQVKFPKSQAQKAFIVHFKVNNSSRDNFSYSLSTPNLFISRLKRK